ncbi:TonB-dependent receptor [Hyphomonas sp.]|uniref:TonB-dependent receptor n=1 Tax=Hyphomonas sp. TaxID=87 RepID=UPI0039192FDA
MATKFAYLSNRRLASWSVLASGVSALSLLTAAPAIAQAEDSPATTAADTDEARQDTVTVLGIRSSIQSAQAIKRNAETFVDAVTAEDIGALPDRSVTEALQRVPGITISRFAAADDPDHFSIEGTGVIVRGLTYVRSEINGRDTFSANNGRALSFSDVAPELLGSVQVFKNQTADLIEGGVAGTVNLVTRKPFDSAGQVLAGTLEYNYADFREEWAPTASVLYSNRWETGIGDVGLLLNGVYSELKTRSDGTQVSSFQARDDLVPGRRVWAPEGAALRSQEYGRERFGYGGSLQWENPDRTMIATLELLRSEASTSWTENVVEIATDNVGDDAFGFLPGTEFGFGSDDLFAFGTISAPVGWRDDQNTPASAGGRRTPVYGLQSNNIRRDVEQEQVTRDLSLNFKWTPNENWAFNFDFQNVDSTVTNVDFGLWGTTFQDAFIDLRKSIPEVRLLGPNVTGFGANPALDCSEGFGATGGCPDYVRPGNEALFADPRYSFWRAAMDHLEDSEGTENAFRADSEYKFTDDSSWLKSVRAGVRWSERDQTTRFSTYNWGALSEIWGNGGPVWMDEVGAPQGQVANFNWENFQRGEVTAPPNFPYYAFNLAQNYGAGAAFADSVVRQWLLNGGNADAIAAGPQGGGGGWRRLADRPGVVAGTPYLPGEINKTLEETRAAYAMLRFGHDNPFGNGMTLDGNIGLRYVETKFSSDGGWTFPQPGDIPIDSGLPSPAGQNRCLAPTDLEEGQVFRPPAFCALSQADRDRIRAFATGANIDVVSRNKYDNWLPSINFRLGLTDEMIIRAAYSKGMSRPDLGLMRNYFTINPLTQDDPRTAGGDEPPPGFQGGWYGFDANGGNPFLKPTTADNYDLSFEWYFAQAGSFTASVFYKEIKDIVVTGQGDLTFTNPQTGATATDVFTRQPTNSTETGKVRGLEIAYQQFYDFLPGPFDGLGLQAALTLLDSDGVQSGGVNNTTTTPAANDALVDLGDLPLAGLSDVSYNIAAIYEKGRISARLAYNWRSDYLVTPRDVITPFYPIFQESTGQLDGSFFFTVNDNLKIGVQGANLLDEVTKTTSFIPDSNGRRGGRSWFRNDRRVTVSARYSF